MSALPHAFDQLTAHALLKDYLAGQPTCCPECTSALTFKRSSDETRASRWMITCKNPRCRKQAGVTIPYAPAKQV